MGALLRPITVFIAAFLSSAQSEPDYARTHSDLEAKHSDEIVVQAQRLTAAALPNTTLIMERGRDNQVKIRIRSDGTFVSYLRGLQSDFGKWRVESHTVCFDGRARGAFCAPTLFGKHPGDTWEAVGLDGAKYKARLLAGSNH
jgi:hypothetical protein